MQSRSCTACGRVGALTGGCGDCFGAVVYCSAGCCASDRDTHAGPECRSLRIRRRLGMQTGMHKSVFDCYSPRECSSGLVQYVASNSVFGILNKVSMDLETGEYTIHRRRGKRVEEAHSVDPGMLQRVKRAVTYSVSIGELEERNDSDLRPLRDELFSAWFIYDKYSSRPLDVPAIVGLFLEIDPRVAASPGGLKLQES